MTIERNATIYRNTDERYGGPELATINDYRELNPEGHFTQDEAHIYEDGKPIADAIARARLHVRVDEGHPLNWDDLKIERDDEELKP